MTAVAWRHAATAAAHSTTTSRRTTPRWWRRPAAACCTHVRTEHIHMYGVQQDVMYVHIAYAGMGWMDAGALQTRLTDQLTDCLAAFSMTRSAY